MCDGNGHCLEQINCENKYYKYGNCDYNCQPTKCPNFLLCNSSHPQWYLDIHDGLCVNCDIMFGRWQKVIEHLEQINVPNIKVCWRNYILEVCCVTVLFACCLCDEI